MKEGEVGQVIGPAYALAAATAALLIGPISDRFGRRRFLLYASVLFGLSLASIGLISDLRVLAGVRLFTGLAAGTFSTCSIAYVADYFPYKRRGVAMSIVQAGQFLALAVGVQVANNIAQWKGWRISFVFFGLLSMVAFMAVLTMLPEDKHEMTDQDPSAIVARRFHNIRMLFDNRERVASIVAAFFVSGGFVGFFFYLGSWLKQALQFTTREFDIVFFVIGIALLIGVVVAGPVSDRFGKRGVSIFSTIVLAAMLLVIPTLGRGIVLFISLMTAALAFAFRQGPLQALATELVPRRARGTLVAARNTASQIGIAATVNRRIDESSRPDNILSVGLSLIEPISVGTCCRSPGGLRQFLFRALTEMTQGSCVVALRFERTPLKWKTFENSRSEFNLRLLPFFGAERFMEGSWAGPTGSGQPADHESVPTGSTAQFKRTDGA